MNRGKTLLRWLLFPPGWAVVVVSVAGYSALFWAFHGEPPQALVYGGYLLSAYALTVDIAAMPRLKLSLKKLTAFVNTHSWILRKIRRTSFGKRYLHDHAFRANVSIWQGMAIDFLYTVFRIVTGIKYASAWFISMALYYFLLGALRGYLIHCYRNFPTDRLSYEYRCYKTMGKLLILLNIPMSGMVILMIHKNSSFIYPGIVIYLSAFYTFYMVTISIMNLWKIRKWNSPILTAARLLNFISAAMSLMGLQTALITRFGTDDNTFRLRMNSITGIGVCALVLGIATYMTVNAHRKLRKVEKG